MTQPLTLPGVEFRAFRGSSDYPELARIITTHSKGEGDDRVETAEGIASGYEYLENCDPARDLVVVEVDGTAVGYTRVFWEQEADGPRVYRMFCFLDPVYCGRGIGTALVEWDMCRLREIAAEHDDLPEKLFETWLNDKNVGAAALIRGAGFEPITYSATMVRPTVDDLPDHRLPDGLEIRPVREEDLRAIWEADVEAFRDHWGFSEQSEKSYQRFLDVPLQRSDAVEDRVGRRGRSRSGQVVHRHGAERGVRPQARMDGGDLDVPPLASAWRREGAHRRVDTRARGARYDRGRSRRAHGEPERCIRPLRRARLRGRGHMDDVPQAARVTASHAVLLAHAGERSGARREGKFAAGGTTTRRNDRYRAPSRQPYAARSDVSSPDL